MIQYILECIAFQLVFLIIYDIFLKRETFFQWNRVFLIGTYALSLILPWIKIEKFKSAVPAQFYVYPEYTWGTTDAVVVAAKENPAFSISWEQGLLFGGMLAALLLFGYKMLQLYRLRRAGQVRHFKDYTQIIIADSAIAFSFLKSIFLGDTVVMREHSNIIEHELVHIKQKHTWDLLFFELMRIVGWFNPLVYVYQNRVSELHEFIADAQVVKKNKEQIYEHLLSEVFQTQHISFINQFFTKSLIRKRIVMLQKAKSKKVWKLKYVVFLPMILGMLFYTSCDKDVKAVSEQEAKVTNQNVTERIEHNGTGEDKSTTEKQFNRLMNRMVSGDIISKEEFFEFKFVSHKMFSETKTVVSEGDTVVYMSSHKPFNPPTDEDYAYYVRREQAFQILDSDLSVSIGSEMDIFIENPVDIDVSDAQVVEVSDVKNMIGDDFRAFNGAINKTFERPSEFEKVLLTDKNHYFSIVPKSNAELRGAK